MSKLYYTIGEVAALLNESSSTLRFWEKEFQGLRPAKNTRGDRRYVESDVELLRRIQHLTRDEGYTIDGAREQLRREKRSSAPLETQEQLVQSLLALKKTLTEFSEKL